MIEVDGSAERGLREYLRQVARCQGVGLESCWYECIPEASAYIALDQRLPLHPDADLALLWDEHTGWCAGIELDGADLARLSYLGQPLLPAPEVVAAFVGDLVAGKHSGHPEPHDLSGRFVDRLPRLLARYAIAAH